eukprot:gene28237-34095_t
MKAGISRIFSWDLVSATQTQPGRVATSRKKKPYPNDSSRHQAQQHNGKNLCMMICRSTFCRSLSVAVLVVFGSRVMSAKSLSVVFASFKILTSGTNISESSSRVSTPVPELPLVAPLLLPPLTSAPSPPEPLQTETSSTPLNLILTADEVTGNPAAAEPAAKSPSIVDPASSPVPNDQLCIVISGRADVVGVWIKASADDSVQDISNVHCLIELKAGVSAIGFRSGCASAAVEQLIFQLMACLVANKSRLRIRGAVTNLFGLHMVECYRTEVGGEITCSISPMVSKAEDVVWALLYLLLDGQQGDGDYSRSGKEKGEEQVSPGGESAASSTGKCTEPSVETASSTGTAGDKHTHKKKGGKVGERHQTSLNQEAEQPYDELSAYGSDDDQGFSSSEEGDAGIDDGEYDEGIHDDEKDDYLLYGSDGVKRRLSFRSLADGQTGAAFDL